MIDALDAPRIHILRGPGWEDKPVPVPDTWGETIVTDCCVCREPVGDVELYWTKPQEWYDPVYRAVCRPGRGCNANPRRKFGMDLRRICHHGA